MSKVKSSLFPRVVTLCLMVSLFAGATPLAAAQNSMTDQEISDKITQELQFDPGVRSTKIDVSTSEGIVTLTGQVDNILAKQRAVRIAEAIKGVRSVVNQVEVRPTSTRSDSQIRNDVEVALSTDPATDSYEVFITVNNGVVSLSGSVSSYQERELVNTVAKGVRGVVGIEDNLDVDYESDRSDNEINQEIDKALRWNALVDDSLIDVDVNNGEVVLSGTVGSASEKREAAATAWVAGVHSVEDEKLSVELWARDEKLREDKYVVKSEQELKQAVEDASIYDPRVNSFNIDVDVNDSEVTLRGTVNNLKAKRAAAENARNTVGVSQVNNYLKVRTDNVFQDSQIAEDIRNALERDPHVERFEITVNVIDGTAHLYGSVDNHFEKNRANEVASRVMGVLEVDNHLNVSEPEVYIDDPYVDDAYVDPYDTFAPDQLTPTRTDARIKESIQEELWWSPFVDSDDITVSVDDGAATLTGTVETWDERQAALENAYEGGAVTIDNDLVVTKY